MKKTAIAVLGLLMMLASVSWASVCPDIQYLDTYKINAPVDGARLAAGADGVVYIADAEGDYLKVISRDGSLLDSKKIPDIVSVGTDADGFVYVGTAKETNGGYIGEVRVYDSALRYVMSLGAGEGEFRFPVSIATDSARVFVVDTLLDVVKVYGIADGGYLAVMGGYGSASSNTPRPTDAAVNAADGKVYITDHALYYSGTTQIIGGRVVTPGTSYGAGVHAYLPDATFSAKLASISYGFTGSNGVMSSPSGVMFDSEGRMYVADGNIGNIQIFDAAGTYLCAVPVGGYPKTPRMTTDGKLAVATSTGIVFFSTDDYVKLAASSESLSFVKQDCAAAPAGKAIIIGNEGPGTLTWSASADAAWISLGSTSGAIAGAGTQELMVYVNAGGLDAGSYSGTVTIASNGGTESFDVSLNVYAAPSLSVSGSGYNFLAHGGTVPDARPLNVSLTGDYTGSMTWSASVSDSWITMAPGAGNSNDTAVAGVGVSAAGLQALSSGSYSGSITVSAGCALVPDVTIPVSLAYYAGGTIEVSTNLGDAAFSIMGPATYTGSGTLWTKYDAPDGDYTVAFGSVQGFITPPPVGIKAAAGTKASASGSYIDLREQKSIIVTMGGSSKNSRVADEAVIMDASGRELGSITISKAGKGNALRGGSVTAAGDFDADGTDEIVVAEKGGVIRGFAADGSALAGFKFFAFDEGVDVDLAAGDIDGDGHAELIVSATVEAGKAEPVINIYKYTMAAGVEALLSFKPFEGRRGANVAAGDIDADGRDEVLVTEAGAGARSVIIRMFRLEADEMADAGSIEAGDSFGAADITAGDIDSDGVDEILITRRADASAAVDSVTGYEANGDVIAEFAGPAKGIRIAAGDVDMDGEAEVVVSEGTGVLSSATVRVYAADGTFSGEFDAFKNNNIYGASVSLGRTTGR